MSARKFLNWWSSPSPTSSDRPTSQTPAKTLSSVNLVDFTVPVSLTRPDPTLRPPRGTTFRHWSHFPHDHPLPPFPLGEKMTSPPPPRPRRPGTKRVTSPSMPVPIPPLRPHPKDPKDQWKVSDWDVLPGNETSIRGTGPPFKCPTYLPPLPKVPDPLLPTRRYQSAKHPGLQGRSKNRSDAPTPRTLRSELSVEPVRRTYGVVLLVVHPNPESSLSVQGPEWTDQLP